MTNCMDETEASSSRPAIRRSHVEDRPVSAVTVSPKLRNPLGKLLRIGSLPGERKKSYIIHPTDTTDSRDRRSSIHGALDHALSPFRRPRSASVGSACAALQFASISDDENDDDAVSLTREEERTSAVKLPSKVTKKTCQKTTSEDEGTTLVEKPKKRQSVKKKNQDERSRT